MSKLLETKKITPETTRAEIEEVIAIYAKQIKDVEDDINDPHPQMSNASLNILEASIEPIKKNKAQLEAILTEFYEAKCELCDHRQKMDIRTMKFICGKHGDGKEVILQW